MKTMIKKALHIGIKNWITLLYFIITYKFIGFVIVSNVLNSLKSAIFQILDVSFIGQQNALLILQHPLALLLLLVILFTLIYYVSLEIVALFIYCEAGWQEQRISIWQLWKLALFRSLRLFRRRNLPIFVIMVPLLGFSVLPLSYGFIDKIQIPEFILDFIYGSTTLHFIFLLFMVLCNIIAFYYLFQLPDRILIENDAELRMTKKKLLHGRALRTAGKILLCILGCVLFFIIMAIAVILLLWICSKLNGAPDGGRDFFNFIFCVCIRSAIYFSVACLAYRSVLRLLPYIINIMKISFLI